MFYSFRADFIVNSQLQDLLLLTELMLFGVVHHVKQLKWILNKEFQASICISDSVSF